MTSKLYNQYWTWWSLDTICSACPIILDPAIYLIQWLLSIRFTPHLSPCVILETLVQNICTQFVFWETICQMELRIRMAFLSRNQRKVMLILFILFYSVKQPASVTLQRTIKKRHGSVLLLLLANVYSRFSSIRNAFYLYTVTRATCPKLLKVLALQLTAREIPVFLIYPFATDKKLRIFEVPQSE